MKILERMHTYAGSMQDILHTKNSAIERATNYTVGGTGIGLSLVEATSYLQFLAALAGAILVCRQLYRDVKKKR